MQSFQKTDYPQQSPSAQYVYYSASSNYQSQKPYNAAHQMPPSTTGSYPGQYYLPPPMQHYPSAETPVVPAINGLEFSTESIRRAFIRKVYSILMVIATRHTMLSRKFMKWKMQIRSVFCQSDSIADYTGLCPFVHVSLGRPSIR